MFADSDDASTSLPGSCRPTDSHAERGRFTVNAVIGTREHFKAVALQRGSHYAGFTGKPPYSNPPYSTGLGSAWDKCCRAGAGPALVIVVEGVRS